MNAIEIKDLVKSYGEKQALNGLNMTVPCGAIYGLIGENGSGKSTTEKIICGLIKKTSGDVKILGKDYNDIDSRASIGVLIEKPGCFPNLSVWTNLMLQATNLSVENKEEKVREILTLLRLEGAAGNKYKNCSLGMKQRVGIALALLGNPKILILDEPINGLDADGVRIVREILVDITHKYNCTVLISSHLLNELEKIATHYGIIRNGKMILEMTSDELDSTCPVFIAIKTSDNKATLNILSKKYNKVIEDENKEYIRIYDNIKPEEVVSYLYENNIVISEITKDKIGLEEYYINLMNEEVK
ncbi:MAG: ABC transporter ATP-binding protein [Anaeroplasmataceae bacterium]